MSEVKYRRAAIGESEVNNLRATRIGNEALLRIATFDVSESDCVRETEHRSEAGDQTDT